MSLHDRLLERSVGAVLGLVLVTMAYGLISGFRADQVWMGLPFAVPMVLAIVATRLGAGSVAAAALTVLTTITMVSYLAVSGGVHSHYAPYVALTVFSGWIWSGPRGGIGVTIAFAVAMLVLGVIDPVSMLENPLPRMDIMIACGVGAVWVGLVVYDLRRSLDERLDATAALEQSAREAQWDAAARDRFLAMVSHEFRTPLNVVLGYEEMLREEEDHPDRIKDLERIHAAGQHLLSLIGDLIDLSSTEDSEVPLAVETVDLDVLIAEVDAITRPLVQLQRNTWSCEPDPDLPDVRADPRRAFQILLNLVSNAAKYTADGEVSLDTEVRDDAVVIAIRDTGVGIPPERLANLFEPFAQVQEDIDQREGLGLGLALSQRWAQAMDGDIDVTSTVGEGSVFRLTLPRANQTRG